MNKAVIVSEKISDFTKEEIDAYAKSRKCQAIEAYRALFSQRLLDKINAGDTKDVLRELVFQLVGTGTKEVKGPVTIISKGGQA